MRPLARWTMGRVHERGWEVLSESLRLFPKIYPEFDCVICCNNMSLEEIARLYKFGVPLFIQNPDSAEFPFKENKSSSSTKNFAWKLIPARLRPSAHELWIDNDIVIRERIAEVDTWLQSNCAIISHGHNPDYGRFSGMVNKTLCAGFFGLPPDFDFRSEIVRHCAGQPLWGFDEQGLVSLIVSSMEHLVVPRERLDMAGVWCPPWRARRMTPNVHFARANQRDEPKHPAWRYYKIMMMP